MVLCTIVFDSEFLDIDHKTCSILFIGVLITVYLKCICQGLPKFTIGINTAYFKCVSKNMWCGFILPLSFIVLYWILITNHKTCSIPFIGVSIIVYLTCICKGSLQDLNDQKKGIFLTTCESESVWSGLVYPYFDI